MSSHKIGSAASVADALRTSIQASIRESTVEVTGDGGHYSLVVTSPSFRGLTMLQSHQLVYRAIAPLMAGDEAPVHAIDQLRTIAE